MQYVQHSIVEPVLSKDILSVARVKSPALFKQCFDIISSNDLVSGKLKLLDQIVQLENFQANLLTFGGSKDSFIPPDSVRAVQKHISSKDFQYIELPFGHVSIMGSEKAKSTVWKTCVDWLKVRSGELVNSNQHSESNTQQKQSLKLERLIVD